MHISEAKMDSMGMKDKGYLSPSPTKQQNGISGLWKFNDDILFKVNQHRAATPESSPLD